jgi:hypothetical protein
MKRADENPLSLRACDGEPGMVLCMSAFDMDRPEVLQIFLQLVERGQCRLVVDSSSRPD